MSKKIKIITFSCLSLALLLITGNLVLAQDTTLKLQQPFGNLPQVLTITGLSIGEYISNILVFGSGVLIIITIVMIIYGGLQWILAGGTPEKINQAKDTIFQSVIGLAIALFAVSILQTINPALVKFGKLDIIQPDIEGLICCQGTDTVLRTKDEGCQSGANEVAIETCINFGWCFDSDGKRITCKQIGAECGFYAECGTGMCYEDGDICSTALDGGKPCELQNKGGGFWGGGVISSNSDMSCKSGICDGDCPFGLTTGESCSNSSQCENGFCASENYETIYGGSGIANTCQPLLGINLECTEVAVDDDDAACESGNCNEVIGFPDYCEY